ncbi:FHA domain-containing protein [Fortiea sp. LEGE XX443]|uniref:FHA domain-containing protein n=1 Tax=Fortiea sp. LEGE XX443 TaxID=1828611 RepID=UPI00187F5E79|nr:FHA domain-containing protein [Fortiea sp. LEGE XX443]MBE9007673.1 FHA domain-containing protein [Fortiea sp. LEGE XX443]
MTEISKSHLFTRKNSAKITELQAKEIERRLSLYQIFVKLYEHHSGLLEDIIQLENLSLFGVTGLKTSYVQGVVDDSTVYLVTNLGENQTQTLRQPQQIWTVGRDRHSGICIADKYLSRRHAAIQYIDNEDEPGFYLVDFKSTNGSFVNGERVYRRIRLKEGDRIRLGNMSFNFFYNHTCRILPTVAMELLMQLATRKECSINETLSNINPETYFPKTLVQAVPFAKNFGLDSQLGHDGLSTEQKSDILDRFFSKITSSPV